MNINSANLFNKSISRLPAGQVIEFIIDPSEILGFFRIEKSSNFDCTLVFLSFYPLQLQVRVLNIIQSETCHV